MRSSSEKRQKDLKKILKRLYKCIKTEMKEQFVQTDELKDLHSLKITDNKICTSDTRSTISE